MYIIEFCLPDFIKINQLFLVLLYFTFSTHHRIIKGLNRNKQLFFHIFGYNANTKGAYTLSDCHAVIRQCDLPSTHKLCYS